LAIDNSGNNNIQAAHNLPNKNWEKKKSITIFFMQLCKHRITACIMLTSYLGSFLRPVIQSGLLWHFVNASLIIILDLSKKFHFIKNNTCETLKKILLLGP